MLFEVWKSQTKEPKRYLKTMSPLPDHLHKPAIPPIILAKNSSTSPQSLNQMHRRLGKHVEDTTLISSYHNNVIQ